MWQYLHFFTLRARLSSPSMEDEDSAPLYPPVLIFFLFLCMLYTYPPPIHTQTCFSIPSLSQYYHSRFSSSVLQNCCKHWISKYWIIVPRGNRGLGSHEPQVTFSSTNQYMTQFYVCPWLKHILFNIYCWFCKAHQITNTEALCLGATVNSQTTN